MHIFYSDLVLNVFLGNSVGTNNTTGSRNTFVGTYSGLNNIAGNDNVFLGLPIEETIDNAVEMPTIPKVESCPTKGKTQKLCV